MASEANNMCVNNDSKKEMKHHILKLDPNFHYDTIKQKFYDILNNRAETQLLPRDTIVTIISKLKRNNSAPSSKYKLNEPFSKFEIIKINGEDCLIKKRKGRDYPIVRIISKEDCFDVLSYIHISSMHGVPKTMRAILALDYGSSDVIPEYYTEIFETLCNTCIKRVNMPLGQEKWHKNANGSFKKSFNVRGQIDILNMTSKNDDKFNYVLYYLDKMTNFMILRPLLSLEKDEIAVELLKIFLDFGPPLELETYNKELIDKAMDILKKTCPIFPITTMYPKQLLQRPKDIEKVLFNWMRKTRCSNWAIGCHLIQWEWNNNRIKNLSNKKTPYELVFGFKSNIVRGQHDENKTFSHSATSIKQANKHNIERKICSSNNSVSTIESTGRRTVSFEELFNLNVDTNVNNLECVMKNSNETLLLQNNNINLTNLVTENSTEGSSPKHDLGASKMNITSELLPRVKTKICNEKNSTSNLRNSNEPTPQDNIINLMRNVETNNSSSIAASDLRIDLDVLNSKIVSKFFTNVENNPCDESSVPKISNKPPALRVYSDIINNIKKENDTTFSNFKTDDINVLNTNLLAEVSTSFKREVEENEDLLNLENSINSMLQDNIDDLSSRITQNSMIVSNSKDGFSASKTNVLSVPLPRVGTEACDESKTTSNYKNKITLSFDCNILPGKTLNNDCNIVCYSCNAILNTIDLSSSEITTQLQICDSKKLICSLCLKRKQSAQRKINALKRKAEQLNRLFEEQRIKKNSSVLSLSEKNDFNNKKIKL